MRVVLYKSVKTNAIPVTNRVSVRRRCLLYVASCLATACLVHLYDRSTMTKRLVSIRFDGILSDPDPAAPWPRIAWLMSFPNSVSHKQLVLWTLSDHRLSSLRSSLYSIAGNNLHCSTDTSSHQHDYRHELWAREHGQNRYPNSQVL
jgi:hypothetical protein